MIHENLDQESSRLLLWFPVGMGLGIAAYLSPISEPSVLVTILFLCMVIGGWFAARRTKFLRLGTLVLLSVAVGFAAIQLKTWRLVHVDKVSLVSDREKGEFSGIIQSAETLKNRQRYVIKLDRGGAVRLSYAGHKDLGVGDHIKFRSTLLPFSGTVLNSGYDYARDAFFKGLSATGRMTDVSIGPQEKTLTGSFQRLRSALSHELFQSMPNQAGAIAVALVTGERGRISDATRQAYADAGIAHVLAISGLHLSLLAGLIFMIFRRGLCLSMILAERFDLKKLSSLMTFPFLIGYLLLSGMGVPAIRSFIMVSIVLLGVLVDRQALSMRTLAFAAIVILLIQPENLVSASFALSFAAVTALISAYEDGWSPLKNWGTQGRGWRRILVYGVGIVVSTLIATLATMPITLYIFNRISLQAIIGNLVAIPLMGFVIMPLLLVTVLTLPFGHFEVLFYLLAQAIGIMTDVAMWTSSLPGAAIQIAKPPEAFIWLTTIGGVWICLWRTKWRFWGLIPFAGAWFLLLVKPDPFVWLSEERQIYWYDGQKLQCFANARRNDFVEGLLQRQLGLSKTEVESDDRSEVTIQGQPILLLNERLPWRLYRRLCPGKTVVASTQNVPDFCHDQAGIVVDRSDLMPQGIIIQFKDGRIIEKDHHAMRRPWALS